MVVRFSWSERGLRCSAAASLATPWILPVIVHRLHRLHPSRGLVCSIGRSPTTILSKVLAGRAWRLRDKHRVLVRGCSCVGSPGIDAAMVSESYAHHLLAASSDGPDPFQSLLQSFWAAGSGASVTSSRPPPVVSSNTSSNGSLAALSLDLRVQLLNALNVSSLACRVGQCMARGCGLNGSLTWQCLA
jgi:hypothetical protein